MKTMRKLLILALMVIFPMIVSLTGCFSAYNVYYDTEDIISSTEGKTWEPSNDDFKETTFGEISSSSLSNGKMSYERWATLDINFTDEWGDATFAFLIFTVEARTTGELHIEVSIDNSKEFETTIYAVDGENQTVMLGGFEEEGNPGKLRISNTPPVVVDEEGNETVDEDYTGYDIVWRINNLQVVGVPNE